MVRTTTTGVVVFRCACGKTVPGTADDVRIFGESLTRAANTSLYDRLLRSAAEDPVNQQVARPCADCGLDRQSQIRIGDAETIVYVCSCGKRS